MKNIKFIAEISNNVSKEKKMIGDCIYYELNKETVAKTFCEETGIWIIIINKHNSEIDRMFLPFASYFEPVRCSEDSPQWYQYIYGDKWYFEETYKHVLPTQHDYDNICRAMVQYMKMFE